MDKKLEDNLYMRFPKLFRQVTLPMSQTAMVWGLQCGPGWYQLIHDACVKLERFCPNAELSTVKEKFGTLRLYIDHSDDISERIADNVYEESVHICEDCGKPGIMRKVNGWFFTACDKHYKIHKKRLNGPGV